MQFLLAVSRFIDRVNERVGRTVYWLVLGAVLVSSGNAMVRYLFDYSSNGWLELQWYLYSGFFLIGAGYTLLRNEHVRIDIISSRLTPRTRAWIDFLGGDAVPAAHGDHHHGAVLAGVHPNPTRVTSISPDAGGLCAGR